MTISNNYSTLATTIRHLKNPNAQTGTLLIEVPADLGRAYNGYKRGGVIEAKEKLSKELMSAAVWLFGIPAFNKIGNVLCEKAFKIPMNIDYSNSKDGRDSIRDTVEYLKNGVTKNLDVSELKKYKNKIKINDVEKTIKNIKASKQIIAISSWAINCILMGIALPKINQALTRKRLKEQEKQPQEQKNLAKFESFEEFKQKTKKNKDVSFTGVADWMTYNLTANNTFRLISTDIPMIIGRCATARNKYEALEVGLMDSAAIYFYNFSLGHCEKLLRKLFPTPDVSSTVGECISKYDKTKLKEIIENISEEGQAPKVKDLFGDDVAKEIYKEATNGRYGKINRFVKNDELKSIDESVKKLLLHIKQKDLIKNGELDQNALKKLIRNTNIKNSAFYGIGIVVSFLGLGILIPKIAYAITKMVTGKDGFVGIQNEEK